MQRNDFIKQIEVLFRSHPIVCLLGPRQCGKTTLSKMYSNHLKKVYVFDLENPQDLESLQNPMLALSNLRGLIILDEIQRKPDLFPILRVLIDKQNTKQKFLLLGSASPDLMRYSSESLAGRIAYLELTPFNFKETHHLEQLWIRGGFPKSYLSKNLKDSILWRKNYISTFLEKDIPALGIKIPSLTLRRFWTMLSHYHGSIFNASELGRSLGIAHTTIRHYLDILSGVFMVRQLQPWLTNLKKRQIKAPKIYFRDTGILHTLLSIENLKDLKMNPKLGASWEGLAVEEIIRYHHAELGDCYFWGTHSGAEIDLLIKTKGHFIGFEFKYADAPKLTKSMQVALNDLGLKELCVIYPGDKEYLLTKNIKVIGLKQYLSH